MYDAIKIYAVQIHATSTSTWLAIIHINKNSRIKKCRFTVFTYSNAVEWVSQTVQGGVWIDALWQTAVEDDVGTVLGLTPAILQVHVHRSQSPRGHQAGKEGFDGRQVRCDWPAVDGRGTDTGTAREKLGRTNRLHLNSKVSTNVCTIDCGYILRAKNISFVSMCSFRSWRPSPYRILIHGLC